MFNKQLDPEDFYYSPEGYIIFTEKYHLKRAIACKSGCKHCPYGYNKKTGLLIKPIIKKLHKPYILCQIKQAHSYHLRILFYRDSTDNLSQKQLMPK